MQCVVHMRQYSERWSLHKARCSDFGAGRYTRQLCGVWCTGGEAVGSAQEAGVLCCSILMMLLYGDEAAV